MALPASGPLSLAQIQVEFGGSNPASLNEYYRGGLYVTTNNTGVPTSGVISISNFYGAVRQFSFTINANLSTPQNLRSLALAAGWNSADPVLVTNNAVISSNTTGSPALTISGAFPAGLTFVNNGTIVGMGGAGGGGNSGGGSAGGTALTVSVGTSINNAGTIAGGGGGGGGGAAGGTGGNFGGGGGGGGGRSGLTNSAAGPSGGYGSAAGAAGTFSAPGGGGGAGYPPYGGAGGTGGGWGSAGAAGFVGIDPVYPTSGAGGAAGSAITGNSNITWIATGTRLGPIT